MFDSAFTHALIKIFFVPIVIITTSRSLLKEVLFGSGCLAGSGCILQPCNSVPQNPQYFSLRNWTDTCCTVLRYIFVDIHLLQSSVNTIHRDFFFFFETERWRWCGMLENLQKTRTDDPMILWENPSLYLLLFKIQSKRHSTKVEQTLRIAQG